MNGNLKFKAIGFVALIIALFLADRVPASTISLSWGASSSPNVAGYAVYYGYSSGDYSTRLDAGNQTNIIFQATSGSVEYFFVATAYTTNGLESAPSNEVRYQADHNSPQVVIVLPSSGSVWNTTNNSVNLAGTANDNSALAQVIWTNQCNNSFGVASGTTNWSVSNVPLCLGTNLITVVARDSVGNIGSAFLSVIRYEPSCTYSIASTNWSVGAAGGAKTIGISTSAGCGWTNSSAAGWLTVSPSSGSGSANATISASANPSKTARTGTVTLAGKNFTVTQAGTTCTYSISSTSWSVGETGGATAVGINATAGCGWTNSSTVGWLTVWPTSGVGSSNITVSASANSSTTARSGVVTVSGQSFTVTQAGATCTYSISSTNWSVGTSGGAAGIGIIASAGCAWTNSSTVSWLTVWPVSGAGSLTATISASANSGTTARTGTVILAGKNLTVTQAGTSCSYSISSTSWAVGEAGGATAVGVTASAGCSWTNSSATSWLTVWPISGNGMSNITIAASANSSTVARTGAVTVAGQIFTVTQGGGACDYSITPNTAEFAANGGNGNINVTAGLTCNWTVSSQPDWVTITSASGTGNGSVTFSVSPNPGCASRSGVMVVAGKDFRISQSGGSGNFSVSTTNVLLSSTGGTFSIEVLTDGGCSWNVVGADQWVQVTSGLSSTGNGTVWLSAGQNASCSPRTCQIAVANRQVTITQAAPSSASLVNASFNGLFDSPVDGAGLFNLKKKGDSFSGKISLAGRSHSYNGRFDSTGYAKVTIKRQGKTPLTLDCQLRPCETIPLDATITDGTWIAPVISDQAVFDARLNPAPDAGTYTIAIMSVEDLSRPPSALTPEGIGYASVQVYSNGTVKASGSLGDGVTFSHSAVISKEGLWPFYVSLYRGQGLIAGWLKFDRNETNNKPEGDLTWLKSANAKDQFYKAGFSSSVAVMGSPYVPPVGLTNRVLNFSDGSLNFVGGDLDSGWRKDVKLLPNNKVVPVSAGADALAFSIRKNNGTFRGTIKFPGYPKASPFRGGILQNRNASYGLFIGKNQSGQMIFEPAP